MTFLENYFHCFGNRLHARGLDAQLLVLKGTRFHVGRKCTPLPPTLGIVCSRQAKTVAVDRRASFQSRRLIQPSSLSGSLAITLISKSKPYSQVTPTPVSVGCGAWPQ